MTEPSECRLLATIQSLLPSLMPAEQAVARQLLEAPAQVIDMSSQQLADKAGTSRATVVRTAQRLGFSGYPQLRVALARQTAPEPRRPASGAAGVVRATFDHVGRASEAMIALLDDDTINRAVDVMASARRLLAIGNGLSTSLAMDLTARLASVGRAVEYLWDPISQQIAARLLSSDDAVVVYSGSGVNRDSLAAAGAAQAAGASVIAITSYQRSELALLADLTLIVGMPNITFIDELSVTTRIPETILTEALVSAIADRLGPSASQAKTLSISMVAGHLTD